jgi:hypothetical protein
MGFLLIYLPVYAEPDTYAMDNTNWEYDGTCNEQ